MAEKTLKTRIQHKHDTEANWENAVNFSPKSGEIIIYDTDSSHLNPRMKIGDGTTNVNQLPFIAFDNDTYVVYADDTTTPVTQTMEYVTPTEMSTALALKADASDLSTLSGTVSTLSTTVAGKADSSTVSALDVRVTALENASGGGSSLLMVDIPSFNSLPRTYDNLPNVTADHVVVSSTLSIPSAQTSRWRVDITAGTDPTKGSISINGSIASATELRLILATAEAVATSGN